MKKLAATLVLLLALTGCSALPSEPPVVVEKVDRTGQVGVQLFMWNWNSIARECTDVLGPAGIDWVETSPPQEHIAGSAWWTHYQPVSYQLESRLGTTEEYQSMIDTCAEAGVGIVADAVINHMAGVGGGTGWAGTEFTKYEYPGQYSRNDFHKCDSATGEISNYRDAEEVTTCELVGLSDLDTANGSVQQKLADYMIGLLRMGVVGFRIDAAKHIAPADLEQIMAKLPENTWVLQEVIRGTGEPIQPEDYIGWGDVFEFGYARALGKGVATGPISGFLQTSLRKRMVTSDKAITFVSNHDTERNGETASYKLNSNDFAIATALMLADPYGKPMLYSGYAFSQRDQGPNYLADGRVQDVECAADSSPQLTYLDYTDGDWVCQHRWPSTLNMIQFRDATAGQPMTDIFKGGRILGFGRGEAGYIFANLDNDPYDKAPLQTSMPAGTYCDVISGNLVNGKCTGLEIQVSESGTIDTPIPAETAIAIHKNAKL